MTVFSTLLLLSNDYSTGLFFAGQKTEFGASDTAQNRSKQDCVFMCLTFDKKDNFKAKDNF